MRQKQVEVAGPNLMDFIEDETELKTLDEMAAILRVPKSWLYGKTRLRGEDGIPHVRIGKYIRFRPRVVIAWAERIATSRG